MDRLALGQRDAAATPLPGASSDDNHRRPAMSLESGDRPVPQRHRLDSHGGARNVQTVSLQAILQGAREAIIDFDGAAYRLRITRNHRLILTK